MCASLMLSSPPWLSACPLRHRPHTCKLVRVTKNACRGTASRRWQLSRPCAGAQVAGAVRAPGRPGQRQRMGLVYFISKEEAREKETL